mmetsp:Transcript_38365/g.90166  ORF Transcript_38365/g.90166 Transcript_38365/m.90166 type:complete len:743 (+) Transcript_38365:91-2319(+)
MDGFNLSEECWEYLDPKGIRRGPFSSATMAAWYDNQMLPLDLGVRYSPSMPFAPISELFPKPMAAFKCQPRTPAVVAMQRMAAEAQARSSAAAAAAAAAAHASRGGGGGHVAADEAACEWQYLDTKGRVQGPFSTTQMRLWYKYEMLPDHLQLRRTSDSGFATIAEYFPAPREPFQSPPVTWSGEKGKAGQGNARGAKAADADTGKDLLRMVQGKATAAETQHDGGGGGNKKAQAKQGADAKGKAQDGKGKKQSGYPADGNDANHYAGGKQAKSNGPVGAGNAAQQGGRKQKNEAVVASAQNAAWWSEGWSAANGSWWEWSAWAGWEGGEESWEQPEAPKGRSKGKQQGGAEWNGPTGEESGTSAATGGTKSSNEKHSGTQAHIASLGWGPKSVEFDLFPEDVVKKVNDEGIVWDVRWVSPLAVRFSQGKVHPFFHARGPITEVLLQIQVSADADDEGRKTEDKPKGGQYKRINPPFPPIRLLHLKQQGVLVTLDNRRLYALQRIALQEWPSVCLIKAFCVDELTPARLKAENRKFTNRLGGLQVEVESRSSAFDTFSWVTEAAQVEAKRFCRPISFKAVDKAISLLPQLIVHTLLSPKMRPFLQSRWALLMYCSKLLPNPEKRALPTRRLLLQHVLELARPGRQVQECPKLCVEYKTETVVTLSKGKSCVSSRLSIAKPLALQKADLLLSPLQRRMLVALMPLFCLPYARKVLRGQTKQWVIAVLLAWGKISASMMSLGLS